MKCYWKTTTQIGQLGKKFTNDYNKFIRQHELLRIDCDKFKSNQVDLGGKFTYLECEDKPVLVEFYERNGFWNFGRRQLDADEKDDFGTPYLIQLLKYLR